MAVGRNRSPPSRITDLDASRHSQANDQTLAVVEFDDQLLSAPVDASNSSIDAELRVGEPAPPATMRVTNHISPMDADPFDRSVQDRHRQLSTDRFYFREFRHRASGTVVRREPAGGRLYSGRRRIRPRYTREVIPRSTPCFTRADPLPRNHDDRLQTSPG